MRQHTLLALFFNFTMAVVLSCAGGAMGTGQHCGNCGRIRVPYPLSTGPNCGDPRYKIRCTSGALWIDGLNGSSSYVIRSIDPLSQRVIIRPPTLFGSSCVTTDFHSQGIQLDPNGPFNITGSNTIFLMNCTDAMLHLQAPINCSTNSLCHSYIRDNALLACERGRLCCAFRTGGSQTSYIIRVHDGGCAAYQSFVNLDSAVAPPAKKWPEPGVELEWVLLREPSCKRPIDCKDLLNSKCLVDRGNVGQLRCFCNSGFTWDPINGFCRSQTVKCPRHGKGCKHRKKQIMLIGGMVASIGCIIFALLLVGILFFNKQNQLKKGAKKSFNKQKKQALVVAKSGSGSSGIFTSKEIMKATNNFSKNNLIGSGGFGEVFKGDFDDGTVTAIKRAKLGNTKGIDQILNEVRILCQVNHRSLVILLGCCVELEQPLLVFEYVPNGTLFDHLHRRQSGKWTPLTWRRRLQIAHQTAQGLAYLHSSAMPPIYHRDVKSSNILLDEKFDAKVSDFGLSRLVEVSETNESHIFTCAQGTLGYLDPEYYRNFQLTDKSDVYSFGVVLLELLTCKKAIDFNREEEYVNLAVYVKKVIKEERLVDVVDAVVKEGANKLELETMVALGYLAAACLDDQRQNRPTMKEVSDEIEYLINVVTGEVSQT